MLHNMAILEQDMRLEASLCLVQHNTTILVWEMGKFDHTTEEMLMAYTSEVNKKGKSQQAVELTDEAQKVSNLQK